ncbi:MAG: hypothetical protein CMJ42_03215 [Phyllobacteriaceae bacterium]|nr:hypothetical protein [Phyllobacteriaceae bacterium]MBA93017.1 hypothetical protein [Phyllobacteriaceae bacterium]
MRQPGDDTSPIQKTPFFEFFDSDPNASEFVIPLRVANIDPPGFEDDKGAIFPDDLAGLDLPSASNSVERAELIVDCLLDAAAGLAGVVNRYKKQEIDRALANQEPDDAPHLMKLREHLEKNARWTLPQWKVKGG